MNDPEVDKGHGMPLRVAELLLDLVAQVVKKCRAGRHEQVIDVYGANRQDIISTDLEQEVLVMEAHRESKLVLQEGEQSDLPHERTIHKTIECLEAPEHEDRNVPVFNSNG